MEVTAIPTAIAQASPEVRAMEQAAEEGDASAQFLLACAYEEGEGVTQDYKEAVRYYKLASRQGHIKANVNLGVLYHQGVGVRQDLEKARQCYEEAATQEEPSAQFNLGLLYYYGQGVRQDYQGAGYFFQLAAAQGHPGAIARLGVLFEFGLGVEQDLNEAMRCYEAAAERGDTNAMIRLGLLYQNRIGESSWSFMASFQMARHYYEQALAQGHPFACTLLDHLYQYTYQCGIEMEHRYYKEGDTLSSVARHTSADADMYSDVLGTLGQLFEHGLGVEQNLESAVHYYERAAELGNVDALYRLQVLYELGIGVEQQDYEQARENYPSVFDFMLLLASTQKHFKQSKEQIRDGIPIVMPGGNEDDVLSYLTRDDPDEECINPNEEYAKADDDNDSPQDQKDNDTNATFIEIAGNMTSCHDLALSFSRPPHTSALAAY